MQQKIILFDGVCNLCNNAVQFVLKHDRKKQFKFASLQSSFGRKILENNHLPADQLQSLLLLDDGKMYTYSSGALRLAKYLDGAWPLIYGFMLVPKFLRDAVYKWVAKNRYKWFGKKEECWLPSPDLNSRFIN